MLNSADRQEGRAHARGAMDAQRLMNFFSACGFRTHRSPSAHWYEAGPRFLLSLPSHRTLRLDAAEIKGIFRCTRAAGLRYVSLEDADTRPSFQIVATGSDYSLARLPASTRSKIRRGLKRFEIRQASGCELESAGERAFLDTIERQGRNTADALRRWRRLLSAADCEEGVEIWSAWEGQTLAAYLIVFLVDDICELYQGRSRNDFLRYYPNNALVYSVTEEMLVRRGLREVTYGIESLENVPTVDAFKASMGFVRKPIAQKVLFHPLLRALLRFAFTRGMVRRLATRKNAAVFWRKAYGLLRFAGLEEQG